MSGLLSIIVSILTCPAPTFPTLPLCAFLLDIAVEHGGVEHPTKFEKALDAKHIPKALKITNLAVPMFLVPFCVCIVFGVFTKVGNACARCCGFMQSSRFKFGDSGMLLTPKVPILIFMVTLKTVCTCYAPAGDDATASETGASLLAREKESVQQGGQLGTQYSLLKRCVFSQSSDSSETLSLFLLSNR